MSEQRQSQIAADMRRWIERQEKVAEIRKAKANYRNHVKRVLRAFAQNLETAERELAACPPYIISTDSAQKQ
jgi:hypothetical protein